ncbi:MAG TPA: hypothetical protein VN939_06305, partial [Chthoniobacterales bacterium]|nr:hypothetical protein [Chthoniobacterales bacterium]
MPAGNTAELIQNLNLLGKGNASAINIFSSALGTLADLSGAVGGVISGIEGIVNLFTPNQQDAYLAQILSEIQQYLVQMYTDIEARFQEQYWQELSNLVSASESTVQSLPNLVAAQPPLTDYDKTVQIETCLQPVNTLTDTTVLPTGSYFVTTYSSMTYYTDAGLYISLNSPFFDSNNNIEFSSGDVGYGTQAPSNPSNDQVFSYLYVLPYCVKAYAALITTGIALYSDFGNNAQRWEGSLISFAQFLTTIHNTIAGGIRKLTPANPSATGDWGSIGSYGQTGCVASWINLQPD